MTQCSTMEPGQEPGAARIAGPSINEPWEREAIFAIIDYWKANASNNGVAYRAAKATSLLLWLLPEVRSGGPVKNPLSGTWLRKPNHPLQFDCIVWDCQEWCDEIGNIVRHHRPPAEPSRSTTCIVCLGAGWIPGAYARNHTCRSCHGTGRVADVLL